MIAQNLSTIPAASRSTIDFFRCMRMFKIQLTWWTPIAINAVSKTSLVDEVRANAADDVEAPTIHCIITHFLAVDKIAFIISVTIKFLIFTLIIITAVICFFFFIIRKDVMVNIMFSTTSNFQTPSEVIFSKQN